MLCSGYCRERQSECPGPLSVGSSKIDELAPVDGYVLIAVPRAYVHERGHRWVECQLFWGRTMGVWCLLRPSDMSS